MGHTTPEQRAPYVERLSLALILPRFLLIGQVALIGGLGMVIMGVVGLMHYASPPSNPFAAYANVLPGQPFGAIDVYGFTCTIYYTDPSARRCTLRPAIGTFTRVEVVYASGLIFEISFETRDYALKVGDVAVLLELSEIRQYRSALFTRRGNIGITLFVNPSEPHSMFRHVSRVTLTEVRLRKP